MVLTRRRTHTSHEPDSQDVKHTLYHTGTRCPRSISAPRRPLPQTDGCPLRPVSPSLPVIAPSPQIVFPDPASDQAARGVFNSRLVEPLNFIRGP